jgi:type II secretory pathway predicted ATPase ExeA
MSSTPSTYRPINTSLQHSHQDINTSTQSSTHQHNHQLNHQHINTSTHQHINTVISTVITGYTSARPTHQTSIHQHTNISTQIAINTFAQCHQHSHQHIIVCCVKYDSTLG